jgi:thioredoxin reductase (NADPH)
MTNNFYFTFGGGVPGCLATSIYAATDGLRVAVIEKGNFGGQAFTSSRIENLIGFPIGFSGAEFAKRSVLQARRFGVNFYNPVGVQHIEKDVDTFNVTLTDGDTLTSQVVTMATGVSYRTLPVPSLDAFNNSGVFYGASVSMAPSHKGQDVAIVGGANSAGQAAVHMARYAKTVYMFVRSPLLKGMSDYLVEQIEELPNIKVIEGVNLSHVEGDKSLRRAVLDTGTGFDISALYIFIGALPNTGWVSNLVTANDDGYIITGNDVVNPRRPRFNYETACDGLFAIGDVRQGSIKRVASAIGEGSVSVSSVHRFREL